jgi:hypothetical protein
VRGIRFLSAALLAVLMTLPGAVVSAAAQVATPTAQTVISPSGEQHIRDFWTRYSVPSAAQDELLKRLAAGEQIDSTRTDTTPASTEVFEAEGMRQTIERFADGSVSVTSMSLPSSSGAIGVFSVGNCKDSESGSGYVNFYDCQASSENGVVTLGFYISYTITSRYDQIIEVGSPYRHCSLGTCDTPKLAIKKKSETSTGSAWAAITTIHTNMNGNGSTKYEMRALVGGNSAWTRWELP